MKRPLLSALAVLSCCALAPLAAAQYCVAGANFCNSSGNELIVRVRYNTIDNASPNNGALPCYTDYSSISTTVTPGSTQTLIVNYSNHASGEKCTVWFDWNRDGVYGGAGSGEQYILTLASPGEWQLANMTVPLSASTGTAGMRVRLHWGSGTPVPCGDNSYGEVEDYTIDILPPTVGACCVLTSPTCSVTSQGACTGSGFTFLGDGTSCTPNLCEGACCVPSSAVCTLTTSGACTGGTYQGNGTTCAPSNPCGGACCDGPTCTVSLASGCPSTSVFLNNAVCGATTCNYCDAAVSVSGCAHPQNEFISHLTFASIDNTGLSDPGSPCYSDYTAISANVTTGQQYVLAFQYTNPTSLDQGVVWIDWNRDLAFGNIASGEQIMLSHPNGDPAAFAGVVTVPVNAAIGSIRMRVRLLYSGTPLACGDNSYGEVEDYTLNVQQATDGACCTGAGFCSIATPGGCASGFQGLGTTCTPSNPCGGACCDTSGNCTVTIAANCPGSSTFVNHGVCSAAACEGACCDASGFCTSVINAAACAGGSYQGAGTACTPSPCPGQSCASTIPLTVDTPVAGDMSASVTTSAISCSVGTNGLWYSFTAPVAGEYAYRSTVTDSSAASPTLALFDACGVEVACGVSVVVHPMSANQTIIFREGALNNVLHTYSVVVNTVVNGACCDPASGNCSATIAAASGCASGTTYMGDNSVCSPNPCGQGACCHAASGACALTTAAGCVSPANQFQGAASTCTPTNPCPIPPQTNFECVDAIALTLNVAVQGNSSLDPGDGTEFVGGSCFFAGPSNFNHTVWFTFTPAETTNYLVSFCGSTFDTAMAIFEPVGTPACSNLSEIACNEDSCIGGTSDNPMPGPGPGNIYASTIDNLLLTAGTTYYIPLACHNSGSFPGFGGPYGVVVRFSVGSCCVDGACSVTDLASCVGGTFGAASSCSPDPCVPSGVCCRGATCTTTLTTAGACAGSLGGALAGATFASAAGCNSGGGTTSPCCYPDYNKAGGVSVGDIFDFLNDWFAGKLFANVGGDGNSGTLAVQNIFDFLNAWFAGGC